MRNQLKELISTLSSIPLSSYSGPAFRMHNPVWAWSPLSMEGAVRMGGRFNPKGSPALYLGLTVNACLSEVSGGSSTKILDPQMLCSYSVNMDGLLDLRCNYDEIFAAPWRLMRLDNREPPGWTLYKALTGYKNIQGIIVPSYKASSESNLVLFNWKKQQLSLHDPQGKLAAVYGERLIG